MTSQNRLVSFSRSLQIEGFSLTKRRYDGLIYPSPWHQPYDPDRLPGGVALLPLSRFVSGRSKHCLGLYARVDAEHYDPERVERSDSLLRHNWSVSADVKLHELEHVDQRGISRWNWTPSTKVQIPFENARGERRIVTRTLTLARCALGLHEDYEQHISKRVYVRDGDGMNCLRSNLWLTDSDEPRSRGEAGRPQKIYGRRGIFPDVSTLRETAVRYEDGLRGRENIADEDLDGQRYEIEWVVYEVRREVMEDGERQELPRGVQTNERLYEKYRHGGWLQGNYEHSRHAHIEDAVRAYEEMRKETE